MTDVAPYDEARQVHTMVELLAPIHMRSLKLHHLAFF